MPAPGVDSQKITDYFNGKGGSLLGLLNLFSGSALSHFSIFALGIMPYVTASIILQLLTVVIPTLEQLQKEGEAGMAKINQSTRYLTGAPAAPDVARRADHEARRRERDLAPHLRLDPLERPRRRARVAQRGPDGEALLPADRARRRGGGRLHPGGA